MSIKERFFPSPAVSSKFKNDFGIRNAANTLFCINLMSSIAVMFWAAGSVSIGVGAFSVLTGMNKSSATPNMFLRKSSCPVNGSTIGVLFNSLATCSTYPCTSASSIEPTNILYTRLSIERSKRYINIISSIRLNARQCLLAALRYEHP